jgi:hypothetical protein
MLAQTKSLEARIALMEARQGLQQVEQQIAGLQEQMNGLLDLPGGTTVELVEPPLPDVPYDRADEVIALAHVQLQALISDQCGGTFPR